MVTCEQVRGLTGALLEGESHPEASAHLAECARCRLLVEELAAVERAARALPVYQPSARLWGRVEAAARHEGLWGQRSWWQDFTPAFFPARPAFAAVLSVTLLVAGALVRYPALEGPALADTQANAFEVAQAELVQAPSYNDRYQIHLQQVEYRVMAEETSPVDPELREITARPLDAVDRAIEQTQQRLAAYPDDTLARDELLRLYRQKATVLQAMSDPVWLDAGR